MLIRTLLLALLIVAVPAPSHAQRKDAPRVQTNVLFIDLNNAEDELEAVAHRLPRRNASLTVVPALSRFSFKDREQILNVKAKYDKQAKAAEMCTLKGKETCPPIWAKMRELELERERLTGAYGIADLIEDLRPFSQRAYDVIVISGHHSRGYFRGEIAELEVAGLAQVDATYPRLFRSARTVILLGCETGTPEMFRDVFPTLFPAANLLIGAEDNAPTRSEARNIAFIEAVMEAEPALHAARNDKTVAKIHRNLLGHRWPVTILWQGGYYFAKKWNGPINEAEQGMRDAELAADDRGPARKKRRISDASNPRT